MIVTLLLGYCNYRVSFSRARTLPRLARHNGDAITRGRAPHAASSIRALRRSYTGPPLARAHDL